MNRLAATVVGASLTLTVVACGSSAPVAAESRTEPVDVVLGWYPTAESGGFHAALEEGFYTDNGLSVTHQPGGPQVSQTQVVAAGRTEFGLTDATTIAVSRAAGIPVVAVAALFQDNPVGVMVHADSGATDWTDLAGRTWYVQTGQPGQEWVRRNGGTDFTTVAYNGSITAALHDPSAGQQGWPTKEVQQARKAGVETRFLSYASAGYNPYNDVIFTTEEYLRDHPDEVRAFLGATLRGWAASMSDTALAEKVNTTLQQEDPQLDPVANWFAWDAQMTELGALEPGLDPARLFDTSALPAVPAPSSLPPAPAAS